MKQKRTYMLWILCCCMAVLLSGCALEGTGQKKDEASYFLYYLDESQTKLLRESYEPQSQEASELIKDLMQKLGSKAEKKEEISLLPEEVTINSYELREDVLVIDFSETYNEMSSVREILVRAGVARTFLQLPGISGVKFTVAGGELADSKGEPVGKMTKDTFIGQEGNDLDSYRYVTLNLYFTNKEGDKLVLEKRNVYYKSSLPLEQIVLEQLIKGPREKGHYPTLPSDTRLLNLITSDRIAYINFNEAFASEALSVSGEIPIYSIVNSLTDMCEVDKAQISVNGKTKQLFKEIMQLDNFYERNEELIAKEE